MLEILRRYLPKAEGEEATDETVEDSGEKKPARTES
jgi:hypothetical protein